MKFKVGDRVRVCHTSNADNVSVGDCGIIVGIDTGHYAVRFDNRDSVYRHDCDGYCETGYGWWCDDDMLEPADADGGKEDKPMRLTFYTTEGYRINTSNNTKIPTITTKVDCIFGDSIQSGSATCDKFNYDERQGVLEAVANALFRGKFDREYNRAVKANKEHEKLTRTCYYCGKVFDTVEERQAHEVWHVDRRKARHERYLLRKRAKEIAFEEQAQKMAKEMLEEQK